MTADPCWRPGVGERRRLDALRLPFLQDRRRLRVGLVNNMPDGALVATERQFTALLQAATPHRAIELVRLHLPGVRRGREARSRVDALYRPTSALVSSRLDVLIVTGAEPCALDLRAEPFWDDLICLVDEAAALGVPTLWSCLAAHAAVLHLDGVVRRPLPQKCSGLYACRAEPSEPLAEGLRPGWVTPHSRNNTLDAAELSARGYRIVSQSEEAGVDVFARDVGRARFLFLQGHPEYEPSSLVLEFKRDMQRYLDGVRETPPHLPKGVFTSASAERLDALLAAARVERRPELMAGWPAASELPAPQNIWREPAAKLVRSWLAATALDVPLLAHALDPPIQSSDTARPPPGPEV